MARPNAIALLTDQQGPGGKRRPLCRQRLEDWRTPELEGSRYHAGLKASLAGYKSFTPSIA